jgi:predicted TIM-barrel fold metal-dependent hydrolase
MNSVNLPAPTEELFPPSQRGSWSRRQWLVGTAGLLAACGSSPEQPEASASPAAEEDLNGRIIDAHVHVWTPDTDSFPISPTHQKADMKPPSFTPEELFAQCRPVGVGRINLIQMSFYQDDHRYMLDAMARYPESFSGTGLLTDVISAQARPAERMSELAGQGLRAFRLLGGSSQRGPRWMDHPNYAALYRLGAERNLALSFLVNPKDMAEVDRLCGQFPETPVIIDHLGRLRVDSETLAEDTEALLRLAARPRVLVKIGAFYALSASGPPYLDLLPLIERVVAAFGAERCMWESDSPFQVQPPHNYAASLALIRDQAHFLSAQQREQILVKTAESHFFVRS